MMQDRRSVRRAIACVGCAWLIIGLHPAAAQMSPAPVPVDQAPSRQPDDAAPSDPNRIEGLRIEGNGALITGPLGARRVYIPLDRPVVPAGFRGLWVGKADLCAAARETSKGDIGNMPDGSLLITETDIAGRQIFAIQQVFVPLPSTFTMAMLDSGRPLLLPASKYRDAPKILVIFSGADGKRDYEELTLLKNGALDLQRGNAHESALRCSK